MTGKFIVFEGIDGCGKGTQIAKAENYFRERGIEVVVTAEPTDGKYGKELRRMLKEGKDPKENAGRFLDLYITDRREHIEKVVKPSLEEGKVVLCDRYKYSTIAYQGAQGGDMEGLVKMHEGMPVPNLVFVFDLPGKDAIDRIDEDEKRQGKEVFEKSGFQEKVRENFLKIGGLLPSENIVIIDAGKAVDEVFLEVRKALDGLL